MAKNTLKRVKAPIVPLEDVDEAAEMMGNLKLKEGSPESKSTVNSTVRRTPAAERSVSIRRTSVRRKSSNAKQPLGVDISFGNSPSTVRQFRRVSDKQDRENEPPGNMAEMDEGYASKALLAPEPQSKETALGRRMYNVGIGLACQEALVNTRDQEKREAISRLAEAWSDLEMVDPEGVFQIIKSSYEKFQA